jgi:precorrin-4/cobalt-precorrin-4 C11-methyltransferase
MTVYFIGAGPGAADLITLRGQRLIERCPVCLFAGSLVPAEIVAAAPAGALVRDTAPMHLDEIVAEMAAAHARGEDVARVHSGDPSIYGAIAEQMRRLDDLAIPYEIVPGVPAFAGAAARLNTELTLPEISQTIILTRTSGKASDMPPRESLEILGQSGATLAIHLSIRNLAYVERALAPHYGADCPVIIVYRATWPDEQIIVTTLSAMREQVREAKITRTALIFVGRIFGETRFRDSSLYAPGFAHILRNAGKKKARNADA